MKRVVKAAWSWVSTLKRAFRSRVIYTRPLSALGASIRAPNIAGVQVSISDEPWMLTALQQSMSTKKGAVLDIGVNVGQTLAKVKLIEPDRYYLGIEPNPECVAYVNNLINANMWPNSHIVCAAIGLTNEMATLEFYTASPVDSCASTLQDARPGQEVMRRVHSCTVTGEQLRQQLQLPLVGIIKVDVEGAELEVLQSVEAILASDRPIIHFELLPNYGGTRTDRVKRQEELWHLLGQHRYAVSRVIKDKGGKLVRTDPITDFGRHSDLNQCEYIARPEK